VAVHRQHHGCHLRRLRPDAGLLATVRPSYLSIPLTKSCICTRMHVVSASLIWSINAWRNIRLMQWQWLGEGSIGHDSAVAVPSMSLLSACPWYRTSDMLCMETHECRQPET
jgi:hypothetical protein